MQGDNFPLKFTKNGAAYKTIGYGLMAGTIISMLTLLIGLVSPKFIGL